MEKLTARYRQLYGRAQGAVDEWDAQQRRGDALLANAANAIGRLPVLADLGNYGVLAEIPGIPEKVQAKQMESLERTLARMQELLGELRSSSSALDKVAADAAQLLQSEVGVNAAGAASRVGAAPSLAELVDGLQDLARMHRQELALKASLVGRVACDVDPEGMGTIVELFGAHPNVDAARVRGIFERASADCMPGKTG